MRVAVVIPVKSFTVAKGRLSDALTPPQRHDLARTCAERVISAAGDMPVHVACSDDEVARWAISQGATVIDCPEPGLDAAVATATAHLSALAFDHVVVAHGDLPLATTLAHVPRAGAATIVPDRHRDGTNVLSFPLGIGFRTAYGPGSFDNHLAIATALGLEAIVLEDRGLGLDLDTIEDLSELERRHKETP